MPTIEALLPQIDYVDCLAQLCRMSYSDFVANFWDTVPGAGKIIWNWHMFKICDELQAAAERVFNNQPKQSDILLNVPPGSSKSTICSILFQPWTWTRMPHARHICASHTDSLVFDLADKSREVLKSDKYRLMYPEVQLRVDTISHLMNSHGGTRELATIGGKSPTGKHAHFLMVDDPIDPKKALSSVELKTADEFMTTTLSSRKIRTDKDIAVTVLVMQRLHHEDPTGKWLERAKVNAIPLRHICLPSELSQGAEVSPPEWKEHYVNGLLDPVRFPRHVLNEQRMLMGQYAYEGQFIQKPIPPGGSMFREEYFSRRVKAAPYNARRRIIYVDRASTLSAGCNSAFVAMCISEDGNYYVEECVTGQWEPLERNQKLRSFALKYRSKYQPKPVEIWIEKEGGASNKESMQSISRALAGFSVREHNVSRAGKEDRADPWSSMLAAGNVYIVEDPSNLWDINAYIKEHISFPQGEFKDRVDASSGGFAILTGGHKPKGLSSYSLNFGKSTKGMYKILLIDPEDAIHVIYNESAILISLNDPTEQGTSVAPTVGLSKLVDTVTLEFADVLPSDYQNRWHEPIEPFGKTVQEIMCTQQHGKRIWSSVLRKRDPMPRLFVICDTNESRSLSTGMALNDTLRVRREETLVRFGEDNWTCKTDDKPPNEHIYDVIKTSRGLVL